MKYIPPWTAEAEARLLYWYGQGYTYQKIADAMNLDRDAVAGKIYRMKQRHFQEEAWYRQNMKPQKNPVTPTRLGGMSGLVGRKPTTIKLLGIGYSCQLTGIRS